MLNFNKTDSVFRPLLVTGMAALMLAGCSDKNKASENGAAATASEYEVAGDHAIGNPDAKVTIVEYASVVCGHCATFHNTSYPDIKQKYVDTGKVRFIFREFPTSPENLARAGFLIANCADENKFFENIALQFKRQNTILQTARSGDSAAIRKIYVDIANAAGLSEADFETCLANEDENAKYDAVVQAGIDAGVNSTPSFFINGKMIRKAPSGNQLFTPQSFDEVLAPLLGEEFSPEAEETPAAEDTPAEH
ncbi:MAG: thioredoxin domain-containing protein [Alphaproteobacteria bacterium]